MRRPTPLPPPPPRAEREPRDLPVATDAAADTVDSAELPNSADFPGSGDTAGSADTPDADEDLAPLLPLAADRTGVLVDDPGRADAAPADEAPVRARDVWAAARARRRALRAEVRRFTGRQRRRRLAWIIALSAIVLLVLGSAGAAYSPLFAVERVRVLGTEQLPAATVEQALSGQVGRPLPLVDSSEVKAALVAFPLVESYTLEARPPHELVVRIVERTPIGSIETAAGHTLVDAAGVALSTTVDRPADHPVISVPGGVTSKAFDAVGRVYRSLPDEIRSQVTAMAATTPHDVTLTLGETGTSVVWGDASQSAKKSVVLQQTMLSLPPEEVSVYDVSSPYAVVVR